MKKQIALFTVVTLLAACGMKKDGQNKLEKDKAKMAELKKQDGELRDKIQTLQDSIDAEGGKQLKTVRVGTLDVVMQPFKHYVDVQASVYGQDDINVSPEMPGVIKSILITEGDKVSKGQVLATIDDAVLLQNIQELKTSLVLADTLYEKQKGLWAQKIGTEVQYLSAKNNYESLQSRLAALQQQDDMSKIKSPIDGMVDALSLKVGETVAPGMPTIQVVNTEQLKVKGSVDEAYIADIHTGDSLHITFPDLNNKEIGSTATYVSRAIDQVNRTFGIEVQLPQDVNYHPNMIALLKIVDYTNPSTVVIPINIVQSDPNGMFVFIAVNENGTWIAKKTPVTVGKVYKGKAEILTGLKASDKLISVGYDDLNNGDAISL